MRRRVLYLAILAVWTLAGWQSFITTAKAAEEAPMKTLQGQVVDRSEAALADAVVYLKNTKNMSIRTFIADRDGNYHFSALAPNVDYEVYADYRGKKSQNKTLSGFDSRASAVINLKIDTNK